MVSVVKVNRNGLTPEDYITGGPAADNCGEDEADDKEVSPRHSWLRCLDS